MPPQTNIAFRDEVSLYPSCSHAKQPELMASYECAARSKQALHDIVIVGGGAGGLELATRLGKTLGKRKSLGSLWSKNPARIFGNRFFTPLLREAWTRARERMNYLAQAHWRHFDYQFGEMAGLNRAAKEIRLAATYDGEGREITPVRTVRYDTLVMAVGSVTNDFGTKGVAQYAISLETAENCPLQPAPCECLYPRPRLKRIPYGPASCTSRLSGREPPGQNLPQSFIAPHAKLSLTD